MSDDIILTPEERQHILARRRLREQRLWFSQGVLAAATHLRNVGDTCAGGRGLEKNPTTGERVGESWYKAAEALESWDAERQRREAKD